MAPPINPATGIPPAVTVKDEADFAVTPADVTVIVPLVAVAGTVTASDVAVAAVTVAVVPLNLTTLFPAVASKFTPLMVTAVPAMPRSGVKLCMAGAVPTVGVMVKVLAEIAVPPGVVTVIFPLVASGTVTVSTDAIEAVAGTADVAVTSAGVPLKVTMLFAGVKSKLVPLIVAVDPTAPLEGELVIVGAVAPPLVVSINFVADVALPPDVATLIAPFFIPAGTITTSDVEVADATTAGTLLANLTALFAALVSKLVPLMVIADPTDCQAGENPEIVGAVEITCFETESVETVLVNAGLPPHALKSNSMENKVTYNAALFFILSS